MMNIFADNNIETISNLFSLVWHRVPIILSGKNEQQAEKLFEELMYFVPEYRKLVFIGDIPKSVLFSQSNPTLLPVEDKELLQDNIIQIFEEESAIDPPIQLICSLKTSEKYLLNELLSHIDRGWISFCQFGVTDNYIKKNFTIKNIQKIKINELTIHAICDELPETRLENIILQKSLNASAQALRFLLQKKMSEVRNAGQAIIQDIEQNRTFTQAEIEEEFEMRSLTFNKVLDITLSESRLDIGSYIELTPADIADRLKLISHIPGIEVIGVMKEGKLIGLARYNEYTFSFAFQLKQLEAEFKSLKEDDNSLQSINYDNYTVFRQKIDGYCFYFFRTQSYNDENTQSEIQKYFSDK
jgi:hypothetical protein